MIRFVLVVFAVTVFSQMEAFTNSCAISAQTGCKPCIRPDPDPEKKVENKPANVTDVELDRTELRVPPPKPGSPPTYPEPSRELLVSVETTASDSEGDVLTYNYTISGGRIVGSGENVTWDLNGVRAGTYTITAGVDDGCGVCGATVVKTVTVKEDESTPACVCSEITISPLHYRITSPHRIYSAQLSGPRRTDLTYNWTISNGTILSGQGNAQVVSRRPEDGPEYPVTVAVEITGLDANCECPHTATRTFER